MSTLPSGALFELSGCECQQNILLQLRNEFSSVFEGVVLGNWILLEQSGDIDSSVLSELGDVVGVPLPFLHGFLDSHSEMQVAVEMRKWQVEELVTAKHNHLLHEVGSAGVLFIPLVEDLVALVDLEDLCASQSVVIFRLWWVEYVPELPILPIEIPLAREGDERDTHMPDLSILEDGAEDLEVHSQDVNDSG